MIYDLTISASPPEVLQRRNVQYNNNQGTKQVILKIRPYLIPGKREPNFLAEVLKKNTYRERDLFSYPIINMSFRNSIERDLIQYMWGDNIEGGWKLIDAFTKIQIFGVTFL